VGKLESYRRTYKKYGVNARALQYTSRQAQEKRLRELVADIDFEDHRPIGPLARRGKSVLDVGCGFGDIIPFISEKTKSFEYTGVDLVPEFIEVARERYPNHRFLIANYFNNPLMSKHETQAPLMTKFDIVITSGTLNANIKNPYRYRKKAIKIMWEHSNEIVAFNMAGGNPQPQNKKGNRVYYADLNKIVDFCKSLTTNIIIRKDYSPNDFTILLFK